jgi:hypothetical protein
VEAVSGLPMLAQAETATVITPSVTQETSDLTSILMVTSVPDRRRWVNSLLAVTKERR